MGLSACIMSDIFSLCENKNSSYNLKSGVSVNKQNLRTSQFGFETVSTTGATFWNDVAAKLKNTESLNFLNPFMTEADII